NACSRCPHASICKITALGAACSVKRPAFHEGGPRPPDPCPGRRCPRCHSCPLRWARCPSPPSGRRRCENLGVIGEVDLGERVGHVLEKVQSGLPITSASCS